jgi:hypothetical protein
MVICITNLVPLATFKDQPLRIYVTATLRWTRGPLDAALFDPALASSLPEVAQDHVLLEGRACFMSVCKHLPGYLWYCWPTQWSVAAPEYTGSRLLKRLAERYGEMKLATIDATQRSVFE